MPLVAALDWFPTTRILTGTNIRSLLTFSDISAADIEMLWYLHTLSSTLWNVLVITLGFNHSSTTFLYFLLYRLTLIDHPVYLIQVWNCAYFTRGSFYWGKKEYICCHSGKQECHIVILCIFVLNSCLSCRSCTPLRTKSPGWKIIHHHPPYRHSKHTADHIEAQRIGLLVYCSHTLACNYATSEHLIIAEGSE